MHQKPDEKRRIVKRVYNSAEVRLREIFNIPVNEMVLSIVLIVIILDLTGYNSTIIHDILSVCIGMLIGSGMFFVIFHRMIKQHDNGS